MSAFLGPIHTWLFNKIKLQDELVNDILNWAEENHTGLGLRDKMNTRYGTLETGALDEIVDATNIHGWLQERVSLVENRLAYAVTMLGNEDENNLLVMNKIAEEFGRKYCIEEDTSAKLAWRQIQDRLLDGMPCDRVNSMITESETVVKYQIVEDIHAPYWNLVGGDVENYIGIKSSIINGMLVRSPFIFQRVTLDTFSLVREDVLCMD